MTTLRLLLLLSISSVALGCSSATDGGGAPSGPASANAGDAASGDGGSSGPASAACGAVPNDLCTVVTLSEELAACGAVFPEVFDQAVSKDNADIGGVANRGCAYTGPGKLALARVSYQCTANDPSLAKAFYDANRTPSGQRTYEDVAGVGDEAFFRFFAGGPKELIVRKGATYATSHVEGATGSVDDVKACLLALAKEMSR